MQDRGIFLVFRYFLFLAIFIVVSQGHCIRTQVGLHGLLKGDFVFNGKKKFLILKQLRVQDQVKRNKIILELPKCIQEAACSQAQISTVPKCLLIATLSLL